jgi:hypothetical protein
MSFACTTIFKNLGVNRLCGASFPGESQLSTVSDLRLTFSLKRYRPVYEALTTQERDDLVVT